jgi:hypothetical protein
MTNAGPISLEDFALLAARRGLKIEPYMLERQYVGYCALQDLMARLPAEPDPATDPALIFLGDATGVGA